MRLKSTTLSDVDSGKIRISTLVDFLSVLCIFFISSHDCLVRLFPALPYSWISILLFAFLVLVVLLYKSAGNYKAVVFLLVTYVILGFEYLLVNGEQSGYLSSLFFQSLAAIRLWTYFMVFSLIKNPEKWNKRLLWLAYINVFLLAVTVLTGNYSSADRVLNYVGLGISAAMWVPIMIQNVFLSKGRTRTLHTIGSVLSIFFVAVYGNRGSLLAILAYVIYCILKYTRAKYKFLIACLVLIFGVIIYNYQTEIITYIANQVSKLGIYSRNLTLLLNGNIAYTTHRTDEIWVRVIDAIEERPLLGYGLCYDRVLSGSIDIYAHNLVLEIILSFGVPVGILLLILHLILGVKTTVGSIGDDWERLLSPFWVTSTVLLMFNNSFCQLSFFWIPYGVYFAYLKNTKKRRLKIQRVEKR